MLGNPPWIKVTWTEGGVLSDFDPSLALRKHSSVELMRERDEAFERHCGLLEAWLTDVEESEATQAFLNATQNYPVLARQQTNLFKCFLPQAWMIGSEDGVAGFLHPEGIYDDPKGGAFRREVYSRLRSHFQFANEKKLFSEVDHHTEFSVNIYGRQLAAPRFQHIANLYAPATVDASFSHDGAAPSPVSRMMKATGTQTDTTHVHSKWTRLRSACLHPFMTKAAAFRSRLDCQHFTPGSY